MEKEALALIWACKRLQIYLVGHHFNLITDHRLLVTIFGRCSKPCEHIDRWVPRLQTFQHTIRYQTGKNIADPLSQGWIGQGGQAENSAWAALQMGR